MLVENNFVHDDQRAVGILAGGDGVTIKNNTVQRTSRQGIWFMGANNSQILNNTVSDIKGAHSNGISVYSASNNITVAGNKISNANSPLTFERSSNLIFL
jgi:parallel beta-helix repeat protein